MFTITNKISSVTVITKKNSGIGSRLLDSSYDYKTNEYEAQKLWSVNRPILHLISHILIKY